MYDLQPMAAPTGKLEESPKLSFNPSTCVSPGYCVLKTVKFRASNLDPGICSPWHHDTLEVVRLGYQSVPDLLRAGKPAVFVHPRLQMHCSNNHVATFSETGENCMSYRSLERIAQADPRTLSVEEALTALQALLIHLGSFLFSPDPEQQADAESFLDVLSEMTETVLLSVKTREYRKQSLWQEWLFGESIRRSIFMSYALLMGFSSFKYGYCSRWLFLESLPFDRRAGLWIAESPQAWIAAAGVSTGEKVGQQLSSFHEFAESAKKSETNLYGDMFLILAEVSHNGPRGKCEIRTGGN